jgi:K+-sensing histidine kinase KdpD
MIASKKYVLNYSKYIVYYIFNTNQLKTELTHLLKAVSERFTHPSLFYDDKGVLVYCNELAKEIQDKLKSTTVFGIDFNEVGQILNLDDLKKLKNKTSTGNTFPTEYTLEVEYYKLNKTTITALHFSICSTSLKKNFDNTTNAFLANLSHEIRTPLNGIIGFAELVMKKTLPPEKVKDYANIIYTNGSYLLKLITDMLDLSRIEAGKLTLYKTQFSLNRLIYDIQLFFLLDMKNRNKQHIMFKSAIGLPDGSDMIFADELRIKQVIINLIGNSIKFTEEGSITIGYKVIANNVLEFFVKDTGIGMSKEAANNIFNRFVQANDSIAIEYGGTGLGLSISKEFVEMHGGKIWVESEPKVGTTFLFTLPIGS